MNVSELRAVLQDLIIRLKDAEGGFKAVENNSTDALLKKYAIGFGADRHNMRLELIEISERLSGSPDTHRSVLGLIHKLFLNFKMIFVDSDIPGIVDEIERGAKKLIEDYERALKEVEMPTDLVTKLLSQKTTVEVELERLKALKKEYTT